MYIHNMISLSGIYDNSIYIVINKNLKEKTQVIVVISAINIYQFLITLIQLTVKNSEVTLHYGYG